MDLSLSLLHLHPTSDSFLQQPWRFCILSPTSKLTACWTSLSNRPLLHLPHDHSRSPTLSLISFSSPLSTYLLISHHRRWECSFYTSGDLSSRWLPERVSLFESMRLGEITKCYTDIMGCAVVIWGGIWGIMYRKYFWDIIGGTLGPAGIM